MSELNEDRNLYGQYFNIIQNVINRMAKNSFLIKAWCITLIAAIFVLTVSSINVIVFSMLIIVTSIFWYLDAYYLKMEKLYRFLYRVKVDEFNDSNKREHIHLFDMDYEPYRKDVKNIINIMLSKTESPFYITINGILIIFLIISMIIA